MQGAQFRHVRIENTAAHLHSLAAVDAQALGVSREKHHKYLIDDSATNDFLLHAGDTCAGYVYIGNDGHIGPLAVAQNDALGTAFETALHIAAQSSSSNVSAFVPATGEAALRLAVEYGMRITLPMVLMATHGVGDWSRYLPRNPGFM